ncbi:MAG TPA: non-homologous end-joining DNA ligase [Kofleriaceae bacterium]|nr:non-homologous end-joining DNA ligase [Kofleriaceae bacterium]
MAALPNDTPLALHELQLATLVAEPPDGPDWLHEQKFDGYRIVAELDHGKVRLLSRRFKEWTTAFPRVAEAVAALPVTRAVLDGEVAAVLPDGRTSFQALQNRDSANVAYFVFDLLAEDDEELVALPLEQRKARLADLVARAGRRAGVIRYSDHVVGGGSAFFALACERGLEGIISKRRDKPYLPGRGTTWLKIKCLHRQELVIGGFTDPEGSRQGIGALLVGYYTGSQLIYAGKVGTGYTHAMLLELRKRLTPIERTTSPFSPEPPRAWTGASRHWVAPELVAEVAFSEWTNDGRLRHPSFQGLRFDKPPREVVREAAAQLARPRRGDRTLGR